MSDRADELKRQRDLLREHLDWLERELAAEEGFERAEAAPEAPYTPPTYASPRPSLIEAEPADNRDAEAILEEYRTPALSIATKTKMGCVAYFVVAMALLGAAVAALYFYMKSVRGH